VPQDAARLAVGRGLGVPQAKGEGEGIGSGTISGHDDAPGHTAGVEADAHVPVQTGPTVVDETAPRLVAFGNQGDVGDGGG